MQLHVIDVVVVAAATAVISATAAVIFDRRFYQDKKIKEWKDENEQFIVELQSKASLLTNRLNSLYGQLSALGIKLQREADPTVTPSPSSVIEPPPEPATSEKRYE